MQVNTSVFDQFPVLHTSRLTLRDIRLTDAEQIFSMRSSKRVNQFIARPDMQETEQAEQLVQRTRTAFENKLSIGWAGVLRDSSEIIGTCGFNQIDLPNLQAEIGGELDVRFWGKHIAFEAVEAIVRFGFDVMNLHRIEARIDPNNRGAVYLLEQLGFEREAYFKDRIFHQGAFRDMAVYTAFSSMH